MVDDDGGFSLGVVAARVIVEVGRVIVVAYCPTLASRNDRQREYRTDKVIGL